MTTILFVCQHGGAKSVIAAEYFNSKGLPLRAVAASAEEPYQAVPAPVAERLERDGFDVRGFRPRQVEAADIDGAMRVVSIGCDVAGDRWDDVPAASEDLEGSVAAIRRHVDALVAELRAKL